MPAEKLKVGKFQETLRQLMKEKSVSAAAVCGATGVPRSTMSEWLSGRRPKLDESIVRLARFFETSVEFMITGKHPEEKLIEDIFSESSGGFVEVHRGTYRVRVERFIGKKGRRE